MRSWHGLLLICSSITYEVAVQQSVLIDARSCVFTSHHIWRVRLTAMHDPLCALRNYLNHSVGWSVQSLCARGIVTTMHRSVSDRNTQLAYPTGTLVTHAFDAAGQQTVMADLTGLTSYSYD